MSILKFNVQTDRVQSTQEWNGEENAPVWIAIKISAGWDQAPETPTIDYVNALIPWRWKSLGTGTSDWNPHDKDSWSVWAIDGKTGKLIDIAELDYVVSAVSKNISQQELLEALDKAIKGISEEKDGGIRADSLSFNAPDVETNPKGTVPGFIERLATLPDPVPRASGVHALLAITPLSNNSEFENWSFIAAPRLAWVTGSIDQVNRDPDKITDVDGRQLEAWQIALNGCNVQMVPSLAKSKMAADQANGRLIDLFDQTINVISGDDAYRQTLPTAEAVAELPQKLANAIDPLSRIRSVLPNAVNQWLDPKEFTDAQLNVRRDALRVGFDSLKRALDLIAIQVLGQRFDLVGRFEVPIVEALLAHAGSERDLLEKFIDSMPWLQNEEEGCIGALRIKEDDITALKLTLDEVSPFTESYLEHALDPAKIGNPVEVQTDADILRRLWTVKEPNSSSIIDGRSQGLRYYEFGKQDETRKYISLRLERRAGPSTPTPDTQEGNTALFSDVSFESVRESASLGFAAPFIEGIVTGRTDWYASDIDQSDRNKPLSERFSDAIQALLWGSTDKPGLYRTLATAVETDKVATNPKKLPDHIANLLEKILELAALEAAKIGGRLGFRADPFDRITPLPLPMTLQVDQLQTFPRTIDVWTRLAGYGLLVARTGYEDENENENENSKIVADKSTDFVSLNPARLYIGGLAEKPTTQFANQTSQGTLVKSVLADNKTSREFVDPWPYSPGDGVGVSDAIAEFSNSWATAPMPGHALVDQPGTQLGVAAARIVAGPPPLPTQKRSGREHIDLLPTFSFGRSYVVLGHLVSQGGVLAPFLRHKTNPYVFKDKFDDFLNGDIKGKVPCATLANYKRTTGIGTPTITHNLPQAPVKIDLITSELPKRSPLIQLRSTGLRINYDHETGGTLVDWPKSSAPGLRFEFVTVNSKGSEVQLEVLFADEEGDFHTVSLPVAESNNSERWWRLDVDTAGNFCVSYQDLDIFAEEQLRSNFETRWCFYAEAQPPRSKPRGVEGGYLSLKCADLDPIFVEPIRVVPLDGTEEVSGVSATRRAKTNASTPILLDGLPLNKSNRTVGRRLTARITGPSIDRHTWERWTNCALFALNATDDVRNKVVNLLGNQQIKSAPADRRNTEQELPDPAVTGLWVELWEIFPKRRRIKSPICISIGHILERPEIEAEIEVDLDAMDASIDWPKKEKNRVVAKLQPGHVYEMRVRAAIEADGKPFDNLRTNKSRLGKAVIESCSVGIDSGKSWLLGQAAVLAIEVATDELPKIVRLSKEVIRSIAAPNDRAIDLVLPPDAIIFNDSVTKTGQTEHIRRTLRYCASAGLVPQRWSWRGTPRAPSDKEAFDDRANSDVGRLVSGPLRAAHVLAAAGVGPKNKLPTIVNRNLDWRGGWNLWRFQVRLTSRYAPLFSQEAESKLDIVGQNNDWITHQEKDADNGRVISRPPFALVLPLTETDDSNGRVPPLLALFYGPMHQNDHFGDMISVDVDIARHPAPALRQDPPYELIDGEPHHINRLKFLPEVGPDPIRTGKGHSGVAIPLKIEGPIGYSFDRDRDTGLFNNSGFIVTPVTNKLAPWSMIKLKFRRQEDSDGMPATIEHKNGQTTFNVSGVLPGLDGRPVRHEGIALQWLGLSGGGDVKIAMEPLPTPSPTSEGGQQVNLKIKVDDQKLKIQAWVLRVGEKNEYENDWSVSDMDPNAGWVEIPREANKKFDLQIVVSAKSKPTDATVWRPAGEVAIQARTKDGNSVDCWLSLFTLPIEAFKEDTPIEQDAQIHLNVNDSPKGEFAILPIRLSDYSASTWCQFTVPSSRFLVEGSDKKPNAAISIADLRLVRKDQDSNVWKDICLKDNNDNSLKLLPDSLSTMIDQPTEEKVASELMFAILTEPSYDSLRHPGERPLAVVPLIDMDGKTVCDKPIWPYPEFPPPKNGFGQWRIMRVLVRKKERASIKIKLEDLFSETLDPNGDINPHPNDAMAIVLSVSRPTKWSF